jgi:multicomponent Na+:H+ antiporter subunit F
MTAVIVVVTILFSVAAALAVIRIVRGPSILDRMVGTDVLLTTFVGALGGEAAFHRNATTLPLLVVVSILGFTASVTVARFVVRRDTREVDS